MLIFGPKDTSEVKDFPFDFSDVLETGEGIASKNVTADGVTVDEGDISGTIVKVLASGGTEGTVAEITCDITTDNVPPRTFSKVGVFEVNGDPVSLETAKAAQKIETADEDAVLAVFLRSAIGHIEKRTGKKLRSKIVSQTIDGFPGKAFCGSPLHGGQNSSRPIRLWYGPTADILSIAYDDQDGVEQTLTDFRLVEGENAKLLPAYGSSWPVTARGPGTVRLSYTAGYDPTELPGELVHAVLMLFGHLNANREAVVVTSGSAAIAELPLGVEALIANYCLPGIA